MEGSADWARCDVGLHARRAVSFGTDAEAYAEHRPDYPEAAVHWAWQPVADRRPLRVLDLAAGTGKLAEVVVRCDAEVVAVEPDLDMLAELRRRVPGVRSLAGSAEQIPLPDGAVDAVLVGQAFHWFDAARAVPEISRVLTPGGVLAALWNYEDDRIEWVAGLTRVARGDISLSRWREGLAPSLPEPFGTAERADFDHAHPRTVDSMVSTVGTHSHVLDRSEGERSRLLHRVREYLLSRPETRSGDFVLPLVTSVVRTRRA